MAMATAAERRIRRIQERVLQVAADDLLGHARGHSALPVPIDLRHARERAPLASSGREGRVLALLTIGTWLKMLRLVCREGGRIDVLVAIRAANHPHSHPSRPTKCLDVVTSMRAHASHLL